MTTSHFSYMREVLKNMAKDIRVDTPSYQNWIDEFIYAEKEEAQSLRDYEKNLARCSYYPTKYSNALSHTNRGIKACCISNEEFETFKMRSTGGRKSVTTMSVDSSQIKLPHSLEKYLDSLPTQDEIASHSPFSTRMLPMKVRE